MKILMDMETMDKKELDKALVLTIENLEKKLKTNNKKIERLQKIIDKGVKNQQYDYEKMKNKANQFDNLVTSIDEILNIMSVVWINPNKELYDKY